MAEKADRVVPVLVEEEGNFIRLQGCFHNPSIQTERKSSSCDNHRDISLLSITGKILTKIKFY